MRNSSMRQPLPANMQPNMATGYQRASGEPVPFEIVGPAPAGSLSSTGADMARFMMAHLNGGELDGQRILSAETARQMHRTRASYGIGPLDRMLLGFFETNVNGHEVIAHLGDTGAFHTSLHLFIDDNTGLYASFNSGGEQGAVNGVRIALFHQFADRYFPGRPDTRRVPAETARQHAQMMAGNWTASRRPDSSFLNVAELLGQTTLSTNGEGELVTPPGSTLTGRPAKWVEVAPFVWQDLNSHTQLAAVVENGQPVRFSMSLLSSFTVYDRPPHLEERRLAHAAAPGEPRDPAADRLALAGPLAGPPLSQGDPAAQRARSARLSPVAGVGLGHAARPGCLGGRSSR